MPIVSDHRWESLEPWSPTLFLVGFALELVFAANHGAAYLVDGVSFVDWIYPTVLVGRIAVLLGLAGLSVRIVNRNPRLGRLSRVVVSLAIVSTIGLMSFSILEIAGFTTPVIAVFGLTTVVLTILTFALFGLAIVRTGAFSVLTGGLMLVASFAVLSVLVGLRFLPTNVIGAVGEGVNAVVFLAMWFSLRAESKPVERAEGVSDAAAE